MGWLFNRMLERPEKLEVLNFKIMKKDVTYLVIILLLLLGGWLGYQHYQKKLDEKDLAYKKEVLKSDKLEKINETQYRKLVADTATIKELRGIVDNLGIKLTEKPKVVEVVKLVPVEVNKPIDGVIVKEDSVSITDYYPKEENYFAKYTNNFNLNTKEGLSKWSFNPVTMSIVLSQREDGIWQSDVKVPDFIEVSDVDIVATPLEIYKNNFGWILGASYGKDFNKDSEFIRISGGFRYKKTYIDIGASSNETVDFGVKFEF